ncbi:hypothetical protein GCM10023192_89550 [Amycolatopsis samaneae]
MWRVIDFGCAHNWGPCTTSYDEHVFHWRNHCDYSSAGDNENESTFQSGETSAGALVRHTVRQFPDHTGIRRDELPHDDLSVRRELGDLPDQELEVQPLPASMGYP